MDRKGIISMIQVKARPGEPAAILLKRFKKACDNEKLKDAMQRIAHYEKPSDKWRRKKGMQSRRAAARQTRVV
jgi:ribosomal protein S21